jgi:hypothetical protein
MRKHIPDTWAFFFGIVLVKTDESLEFTVPLTAEEFLNAIKEFRVFDEVKYRTRYCFFKNTY